MILNHMMVRLQPSNIREYSPPSLPLLPDPLSLGVPARVLSMGQKEIFIHWLYKKQFNYMQAINSDTLNHLIVGKKLLILDRINLE